MSASHLVLGKSSFLCSTGSLSLHYSPAFTWNWGITFRKITFHPMKSVVDQNTLEHPVSRELALYSILLQRRWAETTKVFLLSEYFLTALFISATWRDLCWEKSAGPNVFPRRSGAMSWSTELYPPSMLQSLCMLVCRVGVFSIWSEPHRGWQWWGCWVTCEGWWLLWTLTLGTPCPNPSNLRQVHWKESPRTLIPVFPMGNIWH